MRDEGIAVAESVRVEPAQDDVPDVTGAVRDVLRAPALPVVYAGGSTATAIALLGAVADRAPGRDLFATSGVAGARLAAALGGVETLRWLSPLLPLAERPAAAQQMARRYQELFAAAPPPAALYGYEAMRGVLDAIRRAGKDGNDRQAVIDAYLGVAVAESVIGPYSIGEDGDIAGEPMGGFAVRAGRLRLQRLLTGSAG
jgi:ABC-type branched-subunit amino acid transport system substrate-binding protein